MLVKSIIKYKINSIEVMRCLYFSFQCTEKHQIPIQNQRYPKFYITHNACIKKNNKKYTLRKH